MGHAGAEVCRVPAPVLSKWSYPSSSGGRCGPIGQRRSSWRTRQQQDDPSATRNAGNDPEMRPPPPVGSGLQSERPAVTPTVRLGGDLGTGMKPGFHRSAVKEPHVQARSGSGRRVSVTFLSQKHDRNTTETRQTQQKHDRNTTETRSLGFLVVVPFSTNTIILCEDADLRFQDHRGGGGAESQGHMSTVVRPESLASLNTCN